MPNPTPDLAAVRARVRKQNDMSKRVLATMDDGGIVKRSRQHYDDIDTILAALDAAEAERDRLVEAVNWACGTKNSDFSEPEGAKRYWWRKPLHDKAGLAYDRERGEYVLAARATPTETPE